MCFIKWQIAIAIFFFSINEVFLLVGYESNLSYIGYPDALCMEYLPTFGQFLG